MDDKSSNCPLLVSLVRYSTISSMSYPIEELEILEEEGG
jgi:hypothetical protein